MTTYTWTVSTSGDWGIASNWSLATVPDSSTAIALITQAGSYIVTITAGESCTVNAFTIGNTTMGVGASQPTLEVAGTLQLTGSNPSSAFLQGGVLIDAGGVVQGAATSARPLSQRFHLASLTMAR